MIPTTGVTSVEWSLMNPDCVLIEARLEARRKGYGLLLGLSGDRHHDNRMTDHDLERKHLERGRSLGAVWLDVGDLHCAMQGKWDPRADVRQLRPEYRDPEKPYLDALVDEAADFYAGYDFVVICEGNHESAIRKRHETDLTRRTAEAMRAQGSKVVAGKYAMWVLVKLIYPEKNRSQTLALLLHHGYGGGAPVTKGVIQSARMQCVYPDADVIVTGHTHDSWAVPRPRERISRRTGQVYVDDQHHLRCGTYKDEREGWHMERGAGPNNIGGWWLHVGWSVDKGGEICRPEVTPVPMGRS